MVYSRRPRGCVRILPNKQRSEPWPFFVSFMPPLKKSEAHEYGRCRATVVAQAILLRSGMHAGAGSFALHHTRDKTVWLMLHS